MRFEREIAPLLSFQCNCWPPHWASSTKISFQFASKIGVISNATKKSMQFGKLNFITQSLWIISIATRRRWCVYIALDWAHPLTVQNRTVTFHGTQNSCKPPIQNDASPCIQTTEVFTAVEKKLSANSGWHMNAAADVMAANYWIPCESICIAKNGVCSLNKFLVLSVQTLVRPLAIV